MTAEPSGRNASAKPVPAWLRELAVAARTLEISPQLVPPAAGGRASAVLVLFGDGPAGVDHRVVGEILVS